MVAASQQTIAPALYEAINALVNQFIYFEPDNLEIRRLLVSTNRLMDAEPAKAHLAKALIMVLLGDYEQALNHAKISNTGLPLDNRDLHLANSATTISNCNFYSESHKYYHQINNITSVDPFIFLNSGLNCLALNKLKELIMDAIKAKLDFDKDKAATALRAGEILASAEVTDEVVAKFADVFGEVLRENKLFNAEFHPAIIIGDDSSNWHPHTVFIIFKVKTDATTAAKLYSDSVKRSIKKYGAMPDALHLSIEAVE